MKKLIFLLALVFVSFSTISCSSGWNCKARYVKQDMKIKHQAQAKKANC